MIRLDFVSNSSSSCHIVISYDVSESDKKIYKEDLLNIHEIQLPSKEHGTSEFGWEWIDYKDIWSKLNFCAIQLHDRKKYCTGDIKKMPKYYQEFYKQYKYQPCLKMFKKVCLEKFNLKVEIKEEYDENEKYDYYIDHQSSVTEGRNMDMFKDEDTLYRFLASYNSYVQGGNDNDGGGYYD